MKLFSIAEYNHGFIADIRIPFTRYVICLYRTKGAAV